MKGVELDPLVAAGDINKPLLSKLLAVPKFRERYLGYVKDIANKWLDWKTLGPIAERYAALIAADLKVDTRMLATLESFERSVDGAAEPTGAEPGRGRSMSLKSFAEQRRAYLLSWKPAAPAGPP